MRKLLFRLTCIAAVFTTSAFVGGGEPAVTHIEFSPDGQHAVTCSQSGLSVRKWPSLEQQRTISVEADNVWQCRFSEDGNRLAVVGGIPAESGVLEIYEWPSGTLQHRMIKEGDCLTSVEWLTSDLLVTGSIDRRLEFWDPQKSAPIRELNGHSKAITALVSLPDADQIVSAGHDQSLRVWEASTGRLIRSLNQHTQPVVALAVNNRTEGLPVVASVSKDRTIRFWQPTIGRMVRYIRLESVPLNVCWIDNQLVAASCQDGSVVVIDMTTVQIVNSWQGELQWGHALAVHPDSRDLLVGDRLGQLVRIPSTDVLAGVNGQ